MNFYRESLISNFISIFDENNNVTWPTINCDFLNSNYIMSSKCFGKDEMISTKNLNITDVTINLVNSKPFSNFKSSLNDQQNLGSNLHRVNIKSP